MCVFGADLKSNMAARVHNVSEHIMGPGSHVGFPISTKNTNLVYDHPMNISAKFGSNLTCESFADRKFKMATMTRLSLTLDPMGISHFHLFF
jgi:hypothetical protein